MLDTQTGIMYVGHPGQYRDPSGLLKTEYHRWRKFLPAPDKE